MVEYKKPQENRINDSVWERYEKSRDRGLRNEIVMSYLYIVTCSIKKMQVMTSSMEDLEDMTSHSVLELMNCIDRYDWRKGIQFDTFASIRVRGALIDYIRKKNWVPRDVRKRAKRLNDMSDVMQGELGRPPGDDELAERLDLSPEDVAKIRREEMNFSILAFEEVVFENGTTLMDATRDNTQKTPEGVLMDSEFKERLAEFIDELPEKERTVLSLYYYEELKLKEIAFVMGLTSSRVSQIHSKALSRLRQRMLNYMND